MLLVTASHLCYCHITYSISRWGSPEKQKKGSLFGKNKQLKTEIIKEEKISAQTEEEKEKIKKEGYRVEVKVVDKKQKLVKGARVELHSDPKVVCTNDQGVASFTGVEKGKHTIKIAYKGYQGEQKIKLEGEDVKGFDFTIQAEKKNLFFNPWIIVGFGLLILIISFLTIYIFKLKKKRQAQ